MYSANAPSLWLVVMSLRFSHCEGLPSRQRRHVPHRGDEPPTTSSPTDQLVTLSPMAAIAPLHSCPATTPGGSPHQSRSWWMSEPQIPQECTRTTTSSGPGCGTGRSSTVMTPGDWYTAAAMTAGSGPPDDEPDMGVRLRVRPQPGEPSAQVTQEDGEFPGQGEVAEGGVEAAGRPVLEAPGKRK